ncbi:hypothetical protein SERLADRAFT_442723 [Serpula lacrymans var. lacrymans S7.9]|uniref:Uncharacterized protein n=1 Tax=Serpula lacrymans var. lacrymans (strain S7.9) TaxID=578457 RepID=F8PAR8_SERL9|nr:uncharacterized protein SERLADRAFT_442723 [Serpula lacrymans var. lacrymans S7.9]EGO19906.1 hypothetical protein SERLADRAFT_442723 [Serpula lacrymans var. lacrymans S7.9]
MATKLQDPAPCHSTRVAAKGLMPQDTTLHSTLLAFTRYGLPTIPNIYKVDALQSTCGPSAFNRTLSQEKQLKFIHYQFNLVEQIVDDGKKLLDKVIFNENIQSHKTFSDYFNPDIFVVRLPKRINSELDTRHWVIDGQLFPLLALPMQSMQEGFWNNLTNIMVHTSLHNPEPALVIEIKTHGALSLCDINEVSKQAAFSKLDLATQEAFSSNAWKPSRPLSIPFIWPLEKQDLSCLKTDGKLLTQLICFKFWHFSGRVGTRIVEHEKQKARDRTDASMASSSSSSSSTASATISTTPSLTLTTLLSTLHTHLNVQTRLLPTLHVQLGLPPTALEDELQTLQHTLTRAVESQIEIRRKQVDEWYAKCDGVESECMRYSRALGTNAQVAGSVAALGDLKGEKVLPNRYQRAMEYQEKLRQMYHTKLEQLTTLTNRLNSLSRILGANCFQLDILQPVIASGEDIDNPHAYRDVTPDRFSKLEKELVRGKGEVTKRLNQLAEIFVHIDWLYTELGVDPPTYDDNPSCSSSLAIPSYLLPRSSSSCSTHSNNISNANSDPFLSSAGTSTPTPSSRVNPDVPLLSFASSSPPHISSTPDLPADESRDYYIIFSRFVTLLDSSSSQEASPAALLTSMGVEPTQSMLSWTDKLCLELGELKKRRESHIQAMYDQLEGLWKRMGAEEDAMDGFVEANRGTTQLVVQAYEEELERMLELKRERMGEFIGNARTEIESLWEELMVGDEEREEFAAFADDEHTEDLLSQHEHEIAKLKAEVKLKSPLLASIRKYFDICNEEKELERAASDQTRLLGRAGGRDPGRLLREEKMRRRVGKEKPKLEQQLLTALPSWEKTHDRPFLVHGESILQTLMEAVSAGDQENKKKGPASQYSAQALKSTQGLKPSHNGNNINPQSGTVRSSYASYVPGKSGTNHSSSGIVTPAVRPGSSLSVAHGVAYSNKRQKMTEHARISSPTKGRTPSGGSGLPRPVTQPAPPLPPGTKQVYASLGWGRPPAVMQRATSQNSVSGYGTSTNFGSSGNLGSSVTGRTASGASQRDSTARKASRIRRESFKPRPSQDGMAAGIGGGWRAGFGGISLPEEEGC